MELNNSITDKIKRRIKRNRDKQESTVKYNAKRALAKKTAEDQRIAKEDRKEQRKSR